MVLGMQRAQHRHRLALGPLGILASVRARVRRGEDGQRAGDVGVAFAEELAPDLERLAHEPFGGAVVAAVQEQLPEVDVLRRALGRDLDRLPGDRRDPPPRNGRASRRPPP